MPVSKITKESSARQANLESTKALRAARKAAGLCIACETPTDRLRCVACRVKGAAAAQKVRKARQEEGTCPGCGGEKDSDLRVCSKCQSANAGYRSTHYDKNTENGTCVTCGKPATDGTVTCPDCTVVKNTKERKRRAKLVADGRCRECGAEAELSTRSLRGRERGGYCKECAFKVMAQTAFGSRKLWRMLVEKLDACGWRCPYTGELLVVGDNLSFDHMDPVCRFPEKKRDPSNIEPISWQVNLMKRDLTKQEFLALVNKIHAHTTEEK